MGCLHLRDILREEEDPSAILYKKKILLIGLDNAGKTTILNFIKSKKFVQTEPTVGLNIETIIIKNFEFLIFDVGGKVRTLWSHYYENLSAIIFVVDSTDRGRLWEIREELKKINHELKYQAIPALIFYNKQDLEKVVDFSELIDSTGIKEILELDVIVQKCSAKTGDGVYEGLDKLSSFLLISEKRGEANKLNITYSMASNVQENFLKL